MSPRTSVTALDSLPASPLGAGSSRRAQAEGEGGRRPGVFPTERRAGPGEAGGRWVEKLTAGCGWLSLTRGAVSGHRVKQLGVWGRVPCSGIRLSTSVCPVGQARPWVWSGVQAEPTRTGKLGMGVQVVVKQAGCPLGQVGRPGSSGHWQSGAPCLARHLWLPSPSTGPVSIPPSPRQGRLFKTRSPDPSPTPNSPAASSRAWLPGARGWELRQGAGSPSASLRRCPLPSTDPRAGAGAGRRVSCCLVPGPESLQLLGGRSVPVTHPSRSCSACQGQLCARSPLCPGAASSLADLRAVSWLPERPGCQLSAPT